MQYLYRPNECQMTFQETGARQVYGIDCYRRGRRFSLWKKRKSRFFDSPVFF